MNCKTCGKPTTQKHDGTYWETCFACSGKTATRSSKPQPDWDKIRADKESGMREFNAKNNAALIIANHKAFQELTGDALKDSITKVYEFFKNLDTIPKE